MLFATSAVCSVKACLYHDCRHCAVDAVLLILNHLHLVRDDFIAGHRIVFFIVIDIIVVDLVDVVFPVIIG